MDLGWGREVNFDVREFSEELAYDTRQNVRAYRSTGSDPYLAGYAVEEFGDVTLEILGSIQQVCRELMKQLSRLSQNQWSLGPVEELNPQVSFK
jgi:hypothetical protein